MDPFKVMNGALELKVKLIIAFPMKFTNVTKLLFPPRKHEGVPVLRKIYT